jgi:predicted MFS family arabinose efflux permease
MKFSVSRQRGFWVLAAALVTFFAASSVPSPLYLVYQARWHFSAITLTLIFASYAAALLLTLLTAGGLSDFLGRRRVLAGAIVVELLSMAAFIFADGVGWLLVARAVQGVATGAAAGALSAGVADLAPPERPTLAAAVNTAAPSTGLAIGAVTSGALVEYAPAPRILVFATLIVLFSALLLALAVVPETVTRRPGSLRSLQPRASVPAEARSTFRAMAPVLIATWAVGGLVLSLGPSLAAGVFGARNHLVGGLVVSAVAGFGAAGSVLTRSWAPRPTMVHGALVLVGGVGLVLGALGTGWTALFFAGLVVTGWGFGTAFVGSFGAVASIATPQQRAELFASLYVVSYLAFGGSAVLAGLAVPSYGLRPTATVYGAIVIALSLAAAAAGLRQRRIMLPAEPMPQEIEDAPMRIPAVVR